MSFTVVTSAAVWETALSVQRVASSTMVEAFATCAPMSAIEADRRGHMGRVFARTLGGGRGGTRMTVRFVDHRRHAAGERFELGRRMPNRSGNRHDLTLEGIGDRLQSGGFFGFGGGPLGGARPLGV